MEGKKNPVSWRYASSHEPTIAELSTKCSETRSNKCALDHDYLNRKVLSSMYGFMQYCTCMPVVPVSGDTTHRPHEGTYVPGMVTKLLDRREWDEKARAAIQKEGLALIGVGTWDESTVQEKSDLISNAHKSNEKVIIGELMTICSIKHHECDPAEWLHKGRIVYRGDCARDEEGAPAVYQELAATPTTVVDINANIAYGSLPGHTTTAADAVKAYTQSLLKSVHPTWVVIPPELRPAAWKAKGYHRPVCRLLRSLYGHPEAGAHWQKHLDEILTTKMQATPITSHLSSYWLPGDLFLTVYVDDLLLSGPKGSHDAFWKELEKHVDIEDPESLDRFLGRNHVVSDADEKGRTVTYDMCNYAKQTVEKYKNVTKLENLKHASTPFVPEGSLPEDGECERGELSSSCCS